MAFIQTIKALPYEDLSPIPDGETRKYDFNL